MNNAICKKDPRQTQIMQLHQICLVRTEQLINEIKKWVSLLLFRTLDFSIFKYIKMKKTFCRDIDYSTIGHSVAL